MFNVNVTGEFVAFFVFAVLIISGAVLMVSFDEGRSYGRFLSGCLYRRCRHVRAA